MAIIKCPECGAEVSDKAEKCPKCAYPIIVVNSEEKIQTVQLTRKKYKLLQLSSCLVLFISWFIIAFSLLSKSVAGVIFGFLLLFFSFIWALIVVIKVWWHHG